MYKLILVSLLMFSLKTYGQEVLKETTLFFSEASKESYGFRSKENIDTQNYHEELDFSKILGSNKLVHENIHENISVFVVAKPGINNNWLSLKNKNLVLKKNEIQGIESVRISQSNRPEIFTYLETVPLSINSDSEVFEFETSNDFYEILTFDRGISTKKINVIESYLAMKFGITKEGNYLDSDNRVIWDAKLNQEFSQNILCIGRDDATGLNQKQSSSYDNTFAIGKGQIESLNKINPSVLRDKDFLFVSDNGKKKLTNTKFDRKTDRVWKLYSSNDRKEKYILKFNHEILGSSVDKNVSIKLAISKSPNMEQVEYITVDRVDSIEQQSFFSLDIGADTLYMSIHKSQIHEVDCEQTIVDKYDFVLKEQLTFLYSDYIPTDVTSFWWEYNDEKIYDAELKVLSAGLYTLHYVTSKGCDGKVLLNVEIDTEGILENSNIEVYPNPVQVNNNFSIDIDLISRTDLNVSIYTISGQRILSKQYSDIDNVDIQHKLSLSGIYLVVIKTESEAKIFKIIAQ